MKLNEKAGGNGKKRKKNLKKWDWMRNKMETIDKK